MLITDNWYTCYQLIAWIKSINCYFIGTARLNRVAEQNKSGIEKTTIV